LLKRGGTWLGSAFLVNNEAAWVTRSALASVPEHFGSALIAELTGKAQEKRKILRTSAQPEFGRLDLPPWATTLRVPLYLLSVL
jgi:hypothetical protein